MIIVLHAFIKKTQKTPPQRDLTIARNRIKEIRNHG